MSDITMDEISVVVSGSSDKATDSFERLISALDKLEGSVSTAFNGLKNANNKLNNTTKSVNKIKDVFKSATSGLAKFGLSLGITTVSTSAALSSAIEYTQVYAGFNKVLGTSQKNLERATKFVDDLTDSWYLDKQQVMQATSRYYNMTKTMGMTEDVAFNISKNLTMLSYDLQLLGTTGATVTEVQNQIASALRGEAEGLAKFGISLNQATLQTILYEKGINRTVSSLTAAQKAELIYYQIMRQTYSKHGYYAEQLGKDVLNPAIAVQALKNQFLNLGRAIGSVFIPILSALAPYIIAITQLITQLANTIAGLLGFELGDWGVNSDEISAGFGDIGDSAEQAGKKVKGALGDFDELHTISFPEASGTGIGAGGSLGLDASEFEYGAEWLEVTNEKLEKAKKVINDIKDYLIAIGIVIAGYKISKGILDFIGGFLGLGSDITKHFMRIAVGIGLVLGGAYLVSDAFWDIYENGLNLRNGLELLTGSIATFIGVYSILKGLKAVGLYSKLFGTGSILATASGLTITILALVIGINAFTKAVEGGEQGGKAMAVVLGAMSVAAIGLAIAGFPVVGVVVAITVAVLALIGTIQTVVQAIKSIKDPTIEVKNPLENLSNTFKTLKDTVSEATSGIMGDLDNTAESAKIDFSEIDSSVELASTDVSKYLNTDLSESLNLSGIDILNYKNNVSTLFEETDTNASQSMKDLQQEITGQTSTLKQNAENNFKSFQETVDDKMSKVEGSINGVSDTIDTATTDIDTNTSKWKDMLERGNEAQIKSPSFSWKETINSALTSTLKNVLLALGLPIALPTMAISWVSGAYAEGGFPNAGDLFIANEAGAEWVGSMNGRTAVANNDQISKGVEEASYRGMARALQEYGYAGVTVINKLDSKEIASKTTKVIRSNANMYG